MAAITDPPNHHRRNLILAALLIGGAACLAITGRSFWIDECVTAGFANEPTPARCWSAMIEARFPEVQAPFYMLHIWAWVKVFGDGEWVMRAAGLPWFLAGAAVFAVYFGRAVRSTVVPALVIASSAFAWYYLNEARVYSMQLGCALAAFASAVEVARTLEAGAADCRAWRIFLASLLTLCGTSVLGALWGFFIFCGLLAVCPGARWPALWRLAPLSLAVTGIGLLLLAAYYAWTISLHTKATAVGATTPATVMFVFYELLGLAGLGPGRNELRTTGLVALKPFLMPVALGGIFSLLVSGQGLRTLLPRMGVRRMAVAALMTGLPILALLVVARATQFRALGRHMTPLLPLLLALLVLGVISLFRSGKFSARALAVAFLALSLWSALSIRFVGRHEKDDYRSAAALAKALAARGEAVWWNADPFGAEYYHVAPRAGQGIIPVLQNVAPESLRILPSPDVIVVSKPESFDARGAVAGYVREHGYVEMAATCRAFVFWRKPGPERP